MDVFIRQACLDDVDDLTSLEHSSFDSKIYHLTSRRQFRYLLAKGNAEIWVAIIEGRLCGCAVLFFRATSKMIRFYSLSVHPDYQGHDIGKKLFQKAEQRVFEKGLEGMLLEVREDNSRLKSRYESIGYHTTHTIHNYYPDGASCIKMKKIFQTTA